MWTVWTALYIAACLCWTLAVLHVSAALTLNISIQDQLPNGTVGKSQEDTDWDSPFLQLRASLPSHSQPIRPYSLETDAEAYRYNPKPRDHRPSRLFCLLGSHFDPFWMSVDQPLEATSGSQRFSDSQLIVLTKRLKPSSPQLKEAEAIHQQKLEKEAADLNLSSLPPDSAEAFRGWLVSSASCKLHHRWVDLGPSFWPRWLRQTDCERPEDERSCSFPRGMKCVRGQMAQIKILAWNCLESKDRSKNLKGDNCDGTETREAVRRWKLVPYPVVTSCTCSCK